MQRALALRYFVVTPEISESASRTGKTSQCLIFAPISWRSACLPSRCSPSSIRRAGSPTHWDPSQDWAYRISDQDQDELLAAVDAFRKRRLPLPDVNRENFPLNKLKDVLADIRRELIDGRGLVMVQNFPVDRLDREGIAIAYMGLGSYLGDKMMQNKYGHVLGHVKDIGENYGTTGRSYNTNAEVRFHSDACDYVGLLCLHPAKHGGTSRVASSVTLYNKMLERRPDLVEVLTRDFYRSHNGEMTPGTSPWYKQPIFCFTDGYFSAIGAGSTIEKVLRLPGVPPLTPEQKEAIAGLSRHRRRIRRRHRVQERRHSVSLQSGDAAQPAWI